MNFSDRSNPLSAANSISPSHMTYHVSLHKFTYVNRPWHFCGYFHLLVFTINKKNVQNCMGKKINSNSLFITQKNTGCTGTYSLLIAHTTTLFTSVKKLTCFYIYSNQLANLLFICTGNTMIYSQRNYD